MSFLGEIKRRKVFQVAAVYAVVAWLIVQVVGEISEPLSLPESLDTIVIVVLAIGFPIAVILAWAFEVTPGGVVRDEGNAVPDRSSGRRIELVLIALLVVAVAWIVYREVGPSRPTLLANSVAVLPFENLSADENNAFFAAGIHEAILNELTNIGDLNVIARTSMMRYEGTPLSIREIARELRVETIMEGSVQYADGRVRVTAQLIDPETESHLWSGNYDRNFADVFEIQADIARRIAAELEAELSDMELARIQEAPTRSEEAYALYLRARPLETNMHPAMVLPFYALLEEAVRLDPDFALAHATLAFAYARSLGYVKRGPSGESLDEVEALALSHAQVALDVDRGQGLAHAALAMVDAAYGRVEEARAHWDTAVAMSPNNIDVLDDAVHFYALVGPGEQADSLASRVIDIDPAAAERVQEFASWANDDLGSVTAVIRDRISSDLDFARSSEAYVALGYYEMIQGNADRALEELRFAEELNSLVNNVMRTRLVYTYGRLGLSDDAMRVFTELEDADDGQIFENVALPGDLIFAHLGLGDESMVANLLRQIAESRRPETGSFEDRVFFSRNLMRDPILERPEFVGLRDQLLD